MNNDNKWIRKRFENTESINFSKCIFKQIFNKFKKKNILKIFYFHDSKLISIL